MKHVFLIIIALIYIPVKSQPGKNGLDEGIKKRNLNIGTVDTFFQYRHDTIYKMSYDFSKSEVEQIGSYIKKDNVWVSYYPDYSLKEVGMFTKRKYVLRYCLKRKEYKEFIKVGDWKYYNEKGDLIREINHNKN